MIALAYYAGHGSTASGACIPGAWHKPGMRACCLCVCGVGVGVGVGVARRSWQSGRPSPWHSLSMGLARAPSHVSIGQISGIA
jgi:hypothetical protein